MEVFLQKKRYILLLFSLMRQLHDTTDFFLFCGYQSTVFSYKHETHNLLTLVSGNYSMPRRKEFGREIFTMDRYSFKVSVLWQESPGVRIVPLSLKD